MKTLLIISFTFLLQATLLSQKWDNTFGTTNYKESLLDVIECYDKGYLISGVSLQWEGNWIIKTDINGNLIWDKFILHDSYPVSGEAVYQNSNGELISAGGLFVNNGTWPIITKFDECGNKLWCREYVDYDYEWGIFKDAILLENGEVIALAYFSHQYNYPDNIFLYYIDSNGNLLWKESYASKDEYPDILLPHGKKLYKIINGYMIAGDCYYPSPQGYMRPLFIRLDDDFNESWILPFGVSNSLIAYGMNVIPMNDSTYMGIGTTGYETRLMFFNDEGAELGYNDISGFNVTHDIAKLNDSLYITSTVLNDEISGNAFGEMVIDTAGNVFKSETRPNTALFGTIFRTFDNKYVIGCSYKHSSTNRDIYLYKINDSLQMDTVYPGIYIYDSLCPYQIQSEEIDITDCLLITDVGEIPTPEEYFAFQKTILIKAYPNPSTDGIIHLAYQNTDQHRNLELRCYNQFGEEVHRKKVYSHQGKSIINVIDWCEGLYIVVIYDEGKPVGNTKFMIIKE